MKPRKKALIIVDHGSTYQAANEQLHEAARRLRSCHSPFDIVEPAHMEIASPSISESVERCVAQGADHITVFPYFLAPGRHSSSDIPRLVAEALAAYPAVECVVTPPFGLSDEIIDLVLKIATSTLKRKLRAGETDG